MGVFSRISDFIAANVNALLDKAEDPERMIAQIVREMEQGLAKARNCAASAIAAERGLGRELEIHRGAVERWQTKAREALAAGREDLARRALVRKKEHHALARGLEEQHAGALLLSDQLRTSLHALEARLAEARRKQRALLARQRAVEARREVARTLGNGVHLGATARFERFENRLLDWEDEVQAEAELTHDLDQEFSALLADQEIDRELEALKRSASE